MTIDARKAQAGGEAAGDPCAGARRGPGAFEPRPGAPDFGDAILLAAFLLILVCRDALGG